MEDNLWMESLPDGGEPVDEENLWMKSLPDLFLLFLMQGFMYPGLISNPQDSQRLPLTSV